MGWIAIAIGVGIIVLLIMYCCVRRWCAKRRHGKGKDGGGGGKGLKGFVKGVDLLPSSMKEKVSTQQVGKSFQWIHAWNLPVDRRNCVVYLFVS